MIERKIEAILFDLDGVLINSFESWYQAFNNADAKDKKYKGIQKQIGRIKGHEWVRLIEEVKK